MNFLLKIFLTVALTNSSVFAQVNPFLSDNTSPNESTDEIQEVEEVNYEPSGPSTWPVIGSLITRSAILQRKLQNSIAELMTDPKQNGNSGKLWTLLGLSFLFGILHAIGPGHRKAVLVAYFLGEGTKPLRGIIIGFLLAAVHAVSAIILVGGLYLFTTKSLLLSVNKTQQFLMPFTYGIITLLGIWIVFETIRHKGHKETASNGKTGTRGLIISGIVPCPAASAIMILSVATGAVPIGIISILSMSLGMGVLLASVGLLTILFRKKMTILLKDPVKGKNLERLLHFVSGFSMSLFGLFMLSGLLF